MGRRPFRTLQTPARIGLACALLFAGCSAKRLGTAAVTESAVDGNNNVVSTMTQAEANLEFMSETRMRVDEVRGNMVVNNYETAKKATFWALIGRYGLKAVESIMLGLWLKGKKKPIEADNGVIVKHLARPPVGGGVED